MILQSLLTLLLVSNAQASYRDFSIPDSSATVSVSAFNVVNPGVALGPASVLWVPVLPGHEEFELPIYAFLVEHNSSQDAGGSTRLMFDLGIRQDPLNFAPALAELFKDGEFVVNNITGITERLTAGGIALESIETVIWSHSHFDHIGDMSLFPNSTNLVFGPGTNRVIYPDDPNGVLQASDFAGHNLTEVSFTNATLSFSGLSAIDYFGDGSFYLLDTPGHLPGHMSALARVTPDSFLVLGGDACHHAGQLRPTPFLQQAFPVPESLLASTKTSISTDFFWSRGSALGQFDISSRAEPFLTGADTPGSFDADPELTKVTMEKVQSFDADEDFLVVVAHDESIAGVLDFFPKTLNSWKAQGVKDSMVWAFVDAENPAFVLSPVAST